MKDGQLLALQMWRRSIGETDIEDTYDDKACDEQLFKRVKGKG